MNSFDNQLNEIFNSVNSKIDAAPQLIAETATEHFQQALIKKEWDGKPYEPYKNKKQEPSRGSLMLRTLNLFRSIRSTIVSSERIVISAGSSKVPYARIHNEGGAIRHNGGQRLLTFKRHDRGKLKGRTTFSRNNERASFSQRASVGAYTIQMPQRQFMGKSQSLIDDIKNRFYKQF